MENGINWPISKPQQTPTTLEVYTDASFAADEECRSFGSVQLFWGGALICWSVGRQTLIASHTAESELYSLAEGHLMGKALRPTVAALLSLPEKQIDSRLYYTATTQQQFSFALWSRGHGELAI